MTTGATAYAPTRGRRPGRLPMHEAGAAYRETVGRLGSHLSPRERQERMVALVADLMARYGVSRRTVYRQIARARRHRVPLNPATIDIESFAVEYMRRPRLTIVALAARYYVSERTINNAVAEGESRGLLTRRRGFLHPGAVVTMFQVGMTYRQIATRLDCSVCAIRRIIVSAQATGTLASRTTAYRPPARLARVDRRSERREASA